MGRDGPRLPETADQAREILADQEFFVPRSELPAETDTQRAYVRRLHILLAKTARRFEHSKRAVAGEHPPDSEPELPESLSEAEQSLDGQSFFVPVADLPDDPDRIGEYIETVHLRLARAGRALAHNRRVLREQETTEESGTGVTTDSDTDIPDDASESQQTDAGEEPTVGDETGESTDSTFASDPADSETADVAGREGGGHTSAGSQTDGPAEDDPGAVPGSDTEDPEESGDEQRDRFVYGQFDRSEDGESTAESAADDSDEDRADETGDEGGEGTRPRGLDEIDGTGADRHSGVDEADSETGPQVPDGTDEEGGIERRQLLFGGAVAAVLVAAVGGGLATLLSNSDDGSTDQANDGNTGDTTPENTGGETSGDTTNDGTGGDTGDGVGGDTNDGTGGTDGGTEQSGVFELTDFEADATPAEEYVELAYTGDGEQDISGYILYDGEDGQAHPTEPNSLDPFSFPDGVALSSGESVRVYTGPGESSDDVFYWGYEVNIWNQGGDTVVLEDTTGSVVFESRYSSA